MGFNHTAIYRAYPNVITIDDSRGAFDIEGNKVELDQDLIDSVAADIAAERASIAYRINRQPEYPPIGDQLDALFHAGVFPPEMAAKIQAVKDKYPKSS